MRPGHFCPGNSPKALRGRARSGKSFNEAGAFLPRKPTTASRGAGGGTSFNEAGAFLPRKPRPPLRAERARGRFNEAGAFLPRKPVDDDDAPSPMPLLQ